MTGGDARVAVVILAAGGSTRLGRAKQLLPWGDRTLLHLAARTALDAALGPVLVILGAEADRCAAELDGLEVTIVRHDGWREGMGSTIRVAAERVAGDAAVGAMLVMTCDQPDVAPADLQRLAAEYRRSGAAVIASSYAGTMGIPALFDRRRFPALASLTGDQGAKAILRSEGPSLGSVPCPSAEFDIDTDSNSLRGVMRDRNG